MCWNENVSLNTFIFGIAALLFIWYNNNYTQYKLNEFNNIYFFYVIISFISIQLVEYFLWKSIRYKNNDMNKIFSIIGWVFIRILQPLSIILLIPSGYNTMKNVLFTLYFLFFILIYLYKFFYNQVVFVTSIHKNGHLDWKWAYLYNYERILFVLYMIIFLTLFLTAPDLAFIGIVTILYSMNNIRSTFGSMWCWVSNSILFYYLIQILYVLPYLENKQMC
jgi:hypothetical protein